MTIKDLQESLITGGSPLFPLDIFPTLFDTIIETHLIAQKYFITSDTSLYDHERYYTVREVRRTGGYSIVTIPIHSICKFKTKKDALTYIQKVIKRGL